MKTILIVDDEPAVRNQLGVFLLMHDYQVLKAENADDALDYFVETHIDLMITNIFMPGMNGIELTRYVTWWHETKVIVLTGNDGYQDEAIDAGATEYVLKPVHLESFLNLIENIFNS